MEKMIPHQGWYSQGYRANINYIHNCFPAQINTKKFKTHELDLIAIWARQSIPHPIEKALIELSEIVYYKLTDASRGVENVTQWCKREECWRSVLSIPYDLSDEMESCLTELND